MDGQEIQEFKEGEAHLLCPAVVGDVYQADQTTLWSERKYQMLWITFGKGLLIGYVLALLVHR